jgi:anti-sigma factor RsiW
MNCHRIQKRLAAYQDGEIGGKERERIAAHLEGCPACRCAYAELDRVWLALEKIPEIQASPGFEQRLFAKIHTAPEPRFFWRFPRIFQWFPAPAMALVLMLMGAALGGFLGNVLVSGSRSVPDRAVYSQNSADILSFKIFAAVPPGTLGDGYLRMAHLMEDRRK